MTRWTLIAPAVAKAKKAAKGKPKAEQVGTAIDNTILLVAENLTRQSAVIKHLVKEEKVKIIKRSTTLIMRRWARLMTSRKRLQSDDCGNPGFARLYRGSSPDDSEHRKSCQGIRLSIVLLPCTAVAGAISLGAPPRFVPGSRGIRGCLALSRSSISSVICPAVFPFV